MERPSATDRRLLAEAVAVGAAEGPRTSPNPAVGCVVVGASEPGDGPRRSHGRSDPAGGPHAEVRALAALGDARGATLAVTLEPCAHHGRTPPCTDAIVEAGVRRVVMGVTDPDPVASGGAARLRAAGVEVVGPLDPMDPLAIAVRAELEGFLTRVVRGRPHVTLKVARRPDGGWTGAEGARWVTGPEARAAVHRERARADAVLVGVGTVLADDPRLDVRPSDDDRGPVPVVVDTFGRTPRDAIVVRRGALVVTTDRIDAARRDALERSGARVVVVDRGRDGRVDLAAAMTALAEEGITRVLAEPGPRLAAALASAGLVDRVVVHVAPGASRSRPRLGLVADVVPAGARIERVGRAGADVVIEAGLAVPSTRTAA